MDTIVEAFLPPEEGADDDIKADIELVSTKQAFQALKTLREWVLQQETQEHEFMRHLNNVALRLRKADDEALRQTTMDRYFLPVDA